MKVDENKHFIILKLVMNSKFWPLLIYLPAVIVTDVETDLLGNGRVNEGTRNNRILYDMTAIADPSSGKAEGRDLWEMTTFGSTFPDGRGQRFKPATAYTFTQYQKDRPAAPGENIRYGAVDTNFDMTGLTCNQIRYFCSELRKGEYASPDYQFVAKPDEDVLVDCFELNCEGLCDKYALMKKPVHTPQVTMVISIDIRMHKVYLLTIEMQRPFMYFVRVVSI